MPICQTCQQEWSWKQTMRTLFKLTCPYCGNKQYESAASRKKTSMITLFPTFVLPIFWFTNLSIWIGILVLLVLNSIIFSLLPYYIQLSHEQEPFW